MRRVILESPFKGDRILPLIEKGKTRVVSLAYARQCLRDSLKRGEAPLASHLLYTQVLNDDNPEERKLGIEAGLTWLGAAEAMVVYEDFGITAGMHGGIAAAKRLNITIEYRKILTDEDNRD